MVLVKALRWDEARECVRRTVDASPASELVALHDAPGRVLACDVHADRSYPPFRRAMRDGFALRSADLPGRLRLIGEVRAGEPALMTVRAGECVEIMTGAPAPAGSDCVVMVEHCTRDGAFVQTDRVLKPGDNIAGAGAEACAGERVLATGTRLDYAHVAALATVGVHEVQVHRRPTVAILATGDELVPVEAKPATHQIRNSNAASLAAQVVRTGAHVAYAASVADTSEALRDAIARGLESDVLLLSGGVSAGKYDLVETVLAEFGAEFLFTRVLIQPGQPAVFGRARNKYIFGLPGNPASTMVTFELFAKVALQLLEGESAPPLRLSNARLQTPFRHKTGLTRFLPASLSEDGSAVTPVRWQGSGDVFAIARANAFLVADEDRESWDAGETIRVLPR